MCNEFLCSLASKKQGGALICTLKGSRRMGGGRIYLKSFRVSLFNEDLSIEPHCSISLDNTFKVCMIHFTAYSWSDFPLKNALFPEVLKCDSSTRAAVVLYISSTHHSSTPLLKLTRNSKEIMSKVWRGLAPSLTRNPSLSLPSGQNLPSRQICPDLSSLLSDTPLHLSLSSDILLCCSLPGI